MLRSLIIKLIDRLPFGFTYEVFYQSGRKLGVTGYQCSGAQGNFIGTLSDQSVIKPYLRDRCWSQNIIDLFIAYFEGTKSGTFYDIGANIGLTIVPVARNQNVTCIGFEPDPTNFQLLSANVATNSGSNITLRNDAVADVAGELRFSRNDYNSGDHHLNPNGKLVVKSIALDELQVPTPPFAIKIDTQGAEPLIFVGAKKHLAVAGLIVCEFWPWGMARMGTSPKTILDFVQSFDGVGTVIKNDERAVEFFGTAEVHRSLKRIMAAGGEFDSVDLVLKRNATA